MPSVHQLGEFATKKNIVDEPPPEPPSPSSRQTDDHTDTTTTSPAGLRPAGSGWGCSRRAMNRIPSCHPCLNWYRAALAPRSPPRLSRRRWCSRRTALPVLAVTPLSYRVYPNVFYYVGAARSFSLCATTGVASTSNTANPARRSTPPARADGGPTRGPHQRSGPSPCSADRPVTTGSTSCRGPPHRAGEATCPSTRRWWRRRVDFADRLTATGEHCDHVHQHQVSRCRTGTLVRSRHVSPQSQC